MQHLAQNGHQVLTMDFLGTGFSETADPQLPECNVPFYVDQAMEVIDSLGIMKPFTLWYVVVYRAWLFYRFPCVIALHVAASLRVHPSP